MRRARAICAVWLALALIAPGANAQGADQIEVDSGPEQSFSSSKQFIVKGGDAKSRAAIASIGEELKKELSNLLPLELEKTWRHRIVISLEGDINQARPPSPFKRNIVTGDRFYELRCHLGQGLQLDHLERQLLQLILFEFSLRDIPDDQLTEGMEVPAWTVEGILEAIRFNNQRSERNIYQKLYESGSLMSVEKILEVTDPRKLDATRQAVFSASAGALILALEVQEGGRNGLAAAIQGLILDPSEPRATLQREFPGLQLGVKSLEKWWALQLANMATPLTTDTLSIIETERHLEQILRFQVQEPESGKARQFTVEDWKGLKESPRWRELLLEAQQKLSRLSFRCFPEYRPLMLEYSSLLAELTREEDKNADQRLANLRTDREILLKLAERTRDYLDWYSITQPTPNSKRFSEYQRAMEKLRLQREKNTDPISSYLDAIERFHASQEQR